MAKRLLFGSLMILVLAVLFVGDAALSAGDNPVWSVNLRGLGFTILAGLFVLGGTVELDRLARNRGTTGSLGIAMLAAGALATEPFWGQFVGLDEGVLVMLICSAGLFLAALAQGRKWGTENTYRHLSGHCLAMIYLGGGCFFTVKLRLLGANGLTIWQQIAPLVMVISTVKCADIGAYFTGRAIGRHKWMPNISPKKTWEGFFGGILLSTIVSSLLAVISDIIPFGGAVIFGLVLGVTGQLGDLLESMLKRDGAIKDSASLIPEFGGVLDVVDSVVVAAPFGYMILSLA